MNIILFGPPGAGKGTQTNHLVREYSLFSISTGNLLREEIKKKSPLGNKIQSIINQGSLVSDDIINNLIENALSNKNYSNRLIFDGYPRNLNQAKYLDSLIKKYNQKISSAFMLKIDQEVAVKRIIGRQVCSKCGSIFNKFLNPATNKNHPCDSKFIQKRPDDNEKTIRNRFKIYSEETLPILNFYQNQKILYEIEGKKDILLIFKEIRQIIQSLET